MTCKEHEINNTFNDDDKKFIDFVKGAKFKQCPKCRFWVEKNMVRTISNAGLRSYVLPVRIPILL
jgi:hypothetical protein